MPLIKGSMCTLNHSLSEHHSTLCILSLMFWVYQRIRPCSIYLFVSDLFHLTKHLSGPPILSQISTFLFFSGWFIIHIYIYIIYCIVFFLCWFITDVCADCVSWLLGCNKYPFTPFPSPSTALEKGSHQPLFLP